MFEWPLLPTLTIVSSDNGDLLVLHIHYFMTCLGGCPAFPVLFHFHAVFLGVIGQIDRHPNIWGWQPSRFQSKKCWISHWKGLLLTATLLMNYFRILFSIQQKMKSGHCSLNERSTYYQEDYPSSLVTYH